MNILEALASGPKIFRGEGVNEEQERFIGEMTVQVLERGRAALLCYVAKLSSRQVVHTESTLLGTGPNGKLCLWPVMSEIPAILPHVEIAVHAVVGGGMKSIFSSGPRDDPSTFREEIAIQINPDGSLVYAHAWGLPGSAFEDRSSCLMLPTVV